eukprot:Gb_04377 [translate_table: standard]
MVEIGAEDLLGWEKSPKVNEEKIFVTVRVRPLSDKELMKKEVSDWECINDTTIIFKNTIPERSLFPTAYSFDRAFGNEASTKQVYEEGAKDVALSALSGLNSTIFAYGQTSSGKTYTMKGITDRAVRDIYNYIGRHAERVFLLKFAAMEIYNEVVKDLLSSDSNPLRLLDDPERGTVVEKLVEETVKDEDHLQKLLAMCEAQRQVGETSLNESSSRSHQILRLTIESSIRETIQGSPSSSLVASLNFVDLAGSERASQSLPAGVRLKEGCHINRSLLTLGTVIRKLSGSNKHKNGHIPYRDSKLTRILQPALGGNARTAIICTMSPARSHVEQSRNTLFFASCAKEVATSAHVNVVMSDKALVKHLQKEVARLENELRAPAQSATTHHIEALLQEKELKIKKMEQQMKELVQQRDYAQDRLEDLLRRIKNDQAGKKWESVNLTERVNSYEDEGPVSDLSSTGHELGSDDGHFPVSKHRSGGGNQARNGIPCIQSPQKTQEEAFVCSEESQQSSVTTPKKQLIRESTSNPLMLVQEIRKLEHLQEEVGKDASRALVALQKEVQCLHLAQSGTSKDTALVMTDITGEIQALRSREETRRPPEPIALRSIVDTTLKEEISRLNGSGDLNKLTDTDATIAALEQQLENVQKSIENLVMPVPDDDPASPLSRRSFRSITPQLTRSRSCRAQIMANSPLSPCPWTGDAFEQNENTPPCIAEKASSKRPGSLRKRLFHRNGDTEANTSSREGTPTHQSNHSVDIKKVQNMFKVAAEENIRSIRSYVTELKERVAKLQYQKQLLVCQVMELERNGHSHNDKRLRDVTLDDSPKPVQSPSCWPLEFDKQRMQIIELWDTCYVSIIHRTHFFLLFKGDPADAIYMEVELRRLSFLQTSFSQSAVNCPNLEDDQTINLASSIRALRREREMLARQMQRTLTAEERENLFDKWGVALDTKQRKLQLAQRLWTDTEDMDHIQDSANLVANLVGFWKPGQASKEMFELNFTPQKNNQRLWPSGWNPISTLLNF